MDMLEHDDTKEFGSTRVFDPAEKPEFDNDEETESEQQEQPAGSEEKGSLFGGNDCDIRFSHADGIYVSGLHCERRRHFDGADAGG